MGTFISETQQVAQAIWPYIGWFVFGAGGWITTEFLAKPALRFRHIRGQIKQKMILLSEAPLYGRQPPEDWTSEMAPFITNRDALTALSAELSEFAQSERFARWCIRLMRYDPIRAARAAKKLAFELGTNVEERDKNYRSLDAALKYHFNPKRPFYNAYDPGR